MHLTSVFVSLVQIRYFPSLAATIGYSLAAVPPTSTATTTSLSATSTSTAKTTSLSATPTSTAKTTSLSATPTNNATTTTVTPQCAPTPTSASCATVAFQNLNASIEGGDFLTFTLTATNTTMLTCSIYGGCHTAADAINTGGQTLPDGSLSAITNSSGFCLIPCGL
ncbi:hypothetical protein GGX14DRAFT_441326 [Mycena pura]|uniref:Uncharacterized protein n=1 Tax=Mycena pura TaxID=153505 RepID=A0AAD6YF49_9AGAR|nr:hypothetical protein GGX14DRAFT_441326 [Mycena pura]